MNQQNYENSIAALIGAVAALRHEHPALSGSIRWAVEGIQAERDALQLRAQNAEYLLRENMQMEGVR